MKLRTYSEKLRNPLWQKRRLEIFNRDKWECRLCGDKETTLNVHHLKYAGEPWEAPDHFLITLCQECHLVYEFTKQFNPKEVLHKVVKFRSNERCVCFSIGSFSFNVDSIESGNISSLVLMKPEGGKKLMHFLIDTYINADREAA